MSGTLVLGGARSGKSKFAEQLVQQIRGQIRGQTPNETENRGQTPILAPIYLATARGDDEEIQRRIRHHQQRRGESWTTIEEPLELVATLRQQATNGNVVLVDCLTLWLSNLMFAGADIEKQSQNLSDFVGELRTPVVFVSNEVGQGIVPENTVARKFRDHAGRLHQLMAKSCDDVWFVTAGLPQKLK